MKKASFVCVIWPRGVDDADAALRRLRLDGAHQVDGLVLRRDKFALTLHFFHLRLVIRRLRDGRLVKFQFPPRSHRRAAANCPKSEKCGQMNT